MMGWMAPVAASRCQNGSWLKHHRGEPSMSEIKTIGLDLAKHVFQVHGVDAAGECVLRKRLRRGQVIFFFAQLPRCLVGISLRDSALLGERVGGDRPRGPSDAGAI